MCKDEQSLPSAELNGKRWPVWLTTGEKMLVGLIMSLVIPGAPNILCATTVRNNQCVTMKA